MACKICCMTQTAINSIGQLRQAVSCQLNFMDSEIALTYQTATNSNCICKDVLPTLR